MRNIKQRGKYQNIANRFFNKDSQLQEVNLLGQESMTKHAL